MKNLSRRDLLKMSGMATLGASTFPLAAKGDENPGKKLKIVVVGAHPDDPETGCGGTMTLFAEEGHEVVSVYLTRGQSGIRGKSQKEAALIRTSEAQEACKIMNAKAVFMNQLDGFCEITDSRYTEMYDLLNTEKPDLVFTHWPVDGHRDHRICSILVYDAWLKMEKSFDLYYFEVESGGQTQNFSPTDFVDISPVIEKKHAACNCHVSQNMANVYSKYHEHMEKFRGLQAFGKYKYAEAFIMHHQSSSSRII